MKVILIQSPRRYWPFLSEGDNYILPQWMPCLAASLRNAGHEIKCIDCAATHTGWKSLEDIIRKEEPDVVGVSEAHALYMDESLKLVRLVKKIKMNITVVCGGGMFANIAETLLKENPVDYIVKGEGEETFVELLEALEKERPVESVDGVAYIRNGEYFQTPPRQLIGDMDTLPMPAYDLMPMDSYGRSKYLFSPGGITIHHSRGCPNNCRFCVWWMQMADRKSNGTDEILTPRWRTKSVRKTVDEIEFLFNEYGKKCFIFVDGSWNIDPEWNREFAREVMRRHLKINWFAFMRVDCILRDEKLGIMKELVESGLSHICVGAEHSSDVIMGEFGKKIQDSDSTKECMDIMRRMYPGVFVQATFIVGTRAESKKTLEALAGYVRKLKVDYPAFHIFTPVPGTEMYKEAEKNGWLEIRDFRYYDWNTPIISTENLARKDMEWELYHLYKKSAGFFWLLKGLLSGSRYKRNMYIWWLIVALRLALYTLKERIRPAEHFTRLIKPAWYDR
ncbi:MAG: radical SAM protein [Elusimicrobiota bacterium]